MAATIEDVAEHSGFSTATVSRALRGMPNVTPSTREKVLSSARELDYTIDEQSAALLMQGHGVVAILLPHTGQWFYEKMATSIEAVLFNHDHFPIRTFFTAPQAHRAVIDKILSLKCIDGLILGNTPLNHEDINYLVKLNLPIVSIERNYHVFPSVCFDNYNSALLAMQHLINLGHKNIGLITGLYHESLNDEITHSRVQAYKDALKHNGLEFFEECIVPGNFSYEGGAEAMAKLLSISIPLTAVFCISDEMAIGALSTIRDVNLRVPGDISVIGFDDNDVSKQLNLTTIAQPVINFGERASSMMIQMLENKFQGEEHHSIVGKLVVRGTTGPAK